MTNSKEANKTETPEMSASPVEHLVLLRQTCDGEDFEITFKKPNGSIFAVLIPVDVHPLTSAYGLNLVCRGHYQ